MNADHSCHYYQQGIRLQACGLFNGGAEKEQAIRRHLEECEECRRYAVDLRQLADSMREWQTAGEGIQPPEGSRSKWEKAIVEAANSAPSPQARYAPWLEQLRVFWWKPPRFARAAVGVVWCFILVTQLATPRVATATHSSTGSIQSATAWKVVWNELRTTAQLSRERWAVDRPAPSPSIDDSPRGALTRSSSAA